MNKAIQPKMINQEIEDKIDFYGCLENLYPFTILCGRQFSAFIAELTYDYLLSENIKKAFDKLWSYACIDISSFSNNIWNLRVGQFQIYESKDTDEIKVQYEKRNSNNIDKYYEEGRASFAFKSKKGNILIQQHDQNKEIFLVYISENISTELFAAIKRAEAESLDINTRRIKNQYFYFKTDYVMV